MKLSELKTGEKAVIVKVLGHGGFRKRIVEMGFIRGKAVEVLLEAPLQDPVKYKIMGYEVSLRHDEAAMIEVVSSDEVVLSDASFYDEGKFKLASIGETIDVQPLQEPVESPGSCDSDPDIRLMKDKARKRRHIINVALVGNPNCGKTSLFNFASGAHEKVGNYSGVTVDAKEGKVEFEGYVFNLIDLPGTYSLTAYSPEEIYVRHQIIDKTPDIVINVVDASNIERNLYLTTQLIDMHLRMVCALNMYDEIEVRGDVLDYLYLGKLFGVPMIPTVFKTGKGVEMLFHIIINMYEGVDFIRSDGSINPEVAIDLQNWHKTFAKNTEAQHLEDYASGERPKGNIYRHIHVNHGPILEKSIDKIKVHIQQNSDIRYKYSTRYLAIKLLENDIETHSVIKKLPNGEKIIEECERQASLVKEETGQDCETAIMDAKYGFIRGALKEAGYKEGENTNAYRMTHLLDSIITHRYIGFPLFFLILYAMFQVTFSLGQYPMDWIDAGVGMLSDWLSTTMSDGLLKDMIVDGAIAGVGAVIIFLPQILILYAFISFMEDSGYMARAAFIMDKVLHKMRLHGKSFIPLIMGFGCNVPAIMATRTIESTKTRLVTMLVLPLMSCSARLPIYIMITGIFFTAGSGSLIMIILYVIGIMLAVIVSRIAGKWIVKGEDLPFVMELPPYRFPTGKAMLRHTWEKAEQYLRKMGGIILVASIIVWALGYFPHDDTLDKQTQQEQSYIARIGKAIEPVFKPQGFDWKLDIGLIAGIGAKEVVASTLGVLYGGNEDLNDKEMEDDYNKLRKKMETDGITPLTAISFLLFVLIYFPCIATIAAIKSESGTWRWALFTVSYTTILAWIVSAMVYQIGQIFL